jgi:hypothetical protein
MLIRFSINCVSHETLVDFAVLAIIEPDLVMAVILLFRSIS